MNKSPRIHTPAFKAQVALAALMGDRTLSEIAAQYQGKRPAILRLASSGRLGVFLTPGELPSCLNAIHTALGSGNP